MKISSALRLASLGLLAAATLTAQTTPPGGNSPREKSFAVHALPPAVTYFYDGASHDGHCYLGTDKGLFRTNATGGDIQPWGDLEDLNVSTVNIANNRILVLHSFGSLPPETAVASLADGQFKTISPPWNIAEDGIAIRAVHDRFFAFNETAAFTSPDGQTWTAHPQLANGHLAFADGFWYGFEFHQGGESSWLIRSADLQKWERVSALPSGENFYSLAVDRGIALLGCNDSRILRLDLKNPAPPETITFPRPKTYADISAAGGFFWLQTHQLYASADGKVWTALETLNAALSPPRTPGTPPAGLRHFFPADSSALLSSRDTPARILSISSADLADLARGTLALRPAATDDTFQKLAKEIAGGSLEKRAALREELEKLPPSGEFNKVSAEEIFQKHFVLGSPTPLLSAPPENAIRLAPTPTEFPFLVHALEVNGVLAACGENGFLAEWQGAAWQPVHTASAETFVRLASDGKRFFAVGNRGSLVSWTPGQPARADTQVLPDTAFTGLAHGAGRFVATGSFSGVLTSTDGINWELRPYQKQYDHSPALTQAPVVFGAGKFFIPDTSPLPALLGFVSEDGLTWSEVFFAGNTRLFRPGSFGKFSFGFSSWSPVVFAAGNRLFISGSIKGEQEIPTVLTSTDGINWEPAKGRLGNLPFSFTGAAFHQGRYLSLPSSDGQRIALSSDGLTWDIKTLQQPAGDNGTALASALLGSPMSYKNFAPCHLLARSNGTWVATGKTGLAFSANGASWENNAFDIPMPPPGGTIPGRWVLGHNRALRVSPHMANGVLDDDGHLRPFKGLPENTTLHAAATDGKIWVGFSTAPEQSKSQNLGGGISLESKENADADTLRAWFSADGETWTAVPCPPDARGYKTRVHAVTHTGTAFIAVGSNAAILRSTDGKTWSRESLGEDLRAFASMTENTLPAGKPTRTAWRVAKENSAEKTVRSIHSLEMVAARPGIVLAASPKEIFLSTDDGQTWRWAGWQAVHLRQLAAARDAFWLVGSTFDYSTSALYRSADGVNWQSVLVAPRDKNPVTQKNPGLLSFFADATQLAVTTNDSILTSPDGKNWSRHYVSDEPVTQLVRHRNSWLAEIGSRLVWLHSAEKIPSPAALPVRVAAAGVANAPIRAANPEALYQDGLAYEQGKLGKDIDERILHASIAYRLASDTGHPAAMMGLVRVHFATLQHRSQLTPEARAEYEKEIIDLVGRAAEKNNPEAIRFRAEWYLNGQAGFPKDVAKGIAEYKRAAEMGDWPAMRLLGGIYFQGQHVPRDLKQAELWLEKARAAGDPQAAQILQGIRRGGK